MAVEDPTVEAPETPEDSRRQFLEAVERLGRSRQEELLAEKSERAAFDGGARPSRRSRRGGTRRPEATLDLHGYDRVGARAALRAFLRDQRGTVLIVHGRGGGVLRRVVLEELERSRRVKTFAQAPARLGGAGAMVADLLGGS